MTWIKTSDTFAEDPRWSEAGGGDALWLHMAAMAYCSRHLTDGVFPRSVARSLAPIKRPTRIIEGLIAQGFWQERDKNAYEVVGYLDDQPSAENVRAQKARWNADQQRHRARNTMSGPDSRPDSKAESTVESLRPVPVPVPVAKRRDTGYVKNLGRTTALTRSASSTATAEDQARSVARIRTTIQDGQIAVRLDDTPGKRMGNATTFGVVFDDATSEESPSE